MENWLVLAVVASVKVILCLQLKVTNKENFPKVFRGTPTYDKAKS